MTSVKKNATNKKTNPRSLDSSLAKLEERHRNLLAELNGIGLILRGSIGHRLARCGQPNCRCKADPPILHGPYYVWTRKVAGKTLTVQLTNEQGPRFVEWNKNMRKFERILRDIQKLGLRAAKLMRG